MWSFYHQARELDMLVSCYGSKEIMDYKTYIKGLQQDLISGSCLKWVRIGDDDALLFVTRSLPMPVSWLGSHTKNVNAVGPGISSFFMLALPMFPLPMERFTDMGITIELFICGFLLKVHNNFFSRNGPTARFRGLDYRIYVSTGDASLISTSNACLLPDIFVYLHFRYTDSELDKPSEEPMKRRYRRRHPTGLVLDTRTPRFSQIREEYKDDERGMCPVDYPMDGGDDGDDDDDNSSGMTLMMRIRVMRTRKRRRMSTSLRPTLPLFTEQPPRKRLYLSTLGSRYEVGESSTARPTRGRGIDYGFVSTIDAEERRQGTRDVGYGDRMTLQETVWMVEEEAYASREAWAHSIGLSQTTHRELQTHRDHMQQAELAALRETDRRCQAQMVETLRVIRDMRREMSDMHAELLALREQQRRARQPRPEARIPDHQDASRDADKIELWNLKVKGNDVPAYTESFQELTLICTKFVSNETKKVDKYISGLPDNIYGNVKSARPKTLDETIEFANELMDQKLRTYAERQSDNERKADDLSRNNHGHQQQPFKRQNVAKVYNMGTGEKK
ncbi:hypothetical protein Tco_1216933 [Tanacetum coccineum]